MGNQVSTVYRQFSKTEPHESEKAPAVSEEDKLTYETLSLMKERGLGMKNMTSDQLSSLLKVHPDLIQASGIKLTSFFYELHSFMSIRAVEQKREKALKEAVTELNGGKAIDQLSPQHFNAVWSMDLKEFAFCQASDDVLVKLFKWRCDQIRIAFDGEANASGTWFKRPSELAPEA